MSGRRSMPAFALSFAALAACHAGTGDGGAPPPAATWSQLFSRLPGALISVWGSSAKDVWIVGGDCADAKKADCPAGEDSKGPMVLHYDGAGWTRRLTGHHGSLWWVHGFAAGPIFMGGINGAILRYQGGKFEAMQTPQTAGTVFGIWGDTPANLWAVGGAGGTPSGGFIWHYDGKAWAPDPRAPADLDATATVFKACGTGPNDVWFVGSNGLILHLDGKAIAKVAAPTDQTLFTCVAAGGIVYVVGADGVILEGAGGSFKRVAPDNKQQMNGVSVRGGVGYAAGVYGGILRRDPATGAWSKEDTGIEVQEDFHGAWIDPDGGAWFAGGVVAQVPLIHGVVLYHGTADIPGAKYATQ